MFVCTADQFFKSGDDCTTHSRPGVPVMLDWNPG